VKGQQLFHSFLPSVTLAVLTTQPAWANTAKTDQVEASSSPIVLATSNEANSLVNQLKRSRFQSITDHDSVALSTVDVSNLDTQSIASKNVTKLTLDQDVTAQQEKTPTTVLPISNTTQVVKRTESNKCLPLQHKNTAASLLQATSCSKSQTSVLKMAQVTVPVETENPNSGEIPVPAHESVDNNTSNSTDTDLNNLNPSSNPLLFPTQPEEVRLQENIPLTLEQTLEVAKRNNNELQVSLLELERSKSTLKEAQAALLPTVGLNGSITNRRTSNSTLAAKQSQRFNPNAPDAEADTIFNGEAQIRYDLYTAGRRTAAITEAEEQVRFQELDLERQFEEIRLGVATDYYNLQQADENVRISQSAVENSRASLRDAEALERAGVGTRFDVLRSQVNLANAQQELTNALAQQAIARRRLAVRLNLPQSINISAADPVELAGLWERSLEDSIILAYKNRPELQQQLIQRNINEQRKKQALASLKPQLSLVASYDLLDVYDDSISVSDGYSIGLQATLNLYDGGAAKARAAQANTNIAIAETQFSEQRNQIRFQVEQAYSNQLSNLENVQTANVALEQARESLRLARLRFQAGVGTQTDVINAENELTRSEGNRVRAILDYNRALIELQRSVTKRALEK
jgi:outer membrane protein TolC